MMGGGMELENKIDCSFEYFRNKTGFFRDEIAQLGLKQDIGTAVGIL